jgi:DMSO reductase family type II enzyme chaperone
VSRNVRPEEPFRVALARAQVYRLLARAFGRPDDAFESLVRDGRFRQALEEALIALDYRDTITPGAAGLEQCASLDSDFARLFNPSVDANCPPYETEYTGAHVFMQAQQLADVAGFYGAFGLRVASGFHDRPDHIAVELEFMHVLALKEARALAQGNEDKADICRDAQMKFLRDHLGRWLAAYSQRLSARTREGFYTALAGVASAFIDRDARRLGIVPEIVVPRNAAHPEPPLECAMTGGEGNVAD